MTCPKCKRSYDDSWWWCSECGAFPADGLDLQLNMIVPGYGVQCVITPAHGAQGMLGSNRTVALP
ncbi:MAG TPA: hypothetical protein VFH58_03765 [Acidimicrobiales bacterium]|nr:hypothetical protein [Acidimicrobiales bacterium]